jgi:CubicO group peptidase (beta-lactamase class C family)
MKTKHRAQIATIKNYKISEIKHINCSKDQRFQAASISKVLTALLVLKLVQEKKLNLDKDANIYLKKFKLRNKNGELSNVTLRQLLSHTAGISNSGFPGYSSDSKIPNLNQILMGTKSCNTGKIFVESKPCIKYSYSGGGYIVLQKIIGDVSGEKYDKLVKEKIFLPLGMKNSDFNLRKFRLFRRYPEKAAAGLWTTAEDLCRLVIEIQLSLLGKSNKVISKKSAKLMVTPVEKAENNFIGLGLFISKDKKSFFHTGHNHNFRSKIEGSICSGNGKVVLVNSDKISDLNKLLRGLK